MALPEIRDQARNRWRGILTKLGLPDRHLDGKHGPCPICGGKDRFRFDDKGGEGTFYCSACGAGDGVRFVMLWQGISFQDATKAIREALPDAKEVPVKPETPESRKREMLNAMWRKSKPIVEGDGAWRYLTGRGCDPPYWRDLRYVPKIKAAGCDRDDLSAMIAMVRDADGKPLTIHRTYIVAGEKAPIERPKRLMMRTIRDAGAHIRLSPPAKIMGIAEGIETALRAGQRFGVPVWAGISADGLEKFTPPKVCEKLYIFGDNDEKYRGQAAAFMLAHRLSVQRVPIDVEVCIPELVGRDWADMEE